MTTGPVGVIETDQTVFFFPRILYYICGTIRDCYAETRKSKITIVMKAVARIIAVALSTIVILVSNPLASQANGGRTDSKKALTEEKVSIKYVGSENGQVVFRVEFENPTSEKFSLIIRNDNGDVVYHQQFNDTHFSKNVFIANVDSDIQPTFVIRSADNSEIVRQFRVSKTVTENTTVTRL
jgi:hypothetical protein